MSNKFHIYILGCQYNYYDAKNIAHQLKKMGYIYCKEEKQADIIIVLSCSVRQKPIDRIFGKIKIWQNDKRKIFISGCIMAHDRKKLSQKNVVLFEINKINKYFKILNNNYPKCKEIYFIPKNESNQTAYIPIMQGCNNFCTYCAVPYTRGREISRKPIEIIKEIKKELINEKKHIILLGQNVNSYQFKHQKPNIKNDDNNFSSLLNKIDRLTGKFDYNFMSPNPRNFSKELIDFLPKAKKWNRHLHLPLQSGNNKILKKMNRKYLVKNYTDIVLNLKSKVLNLKLTTDIIVGFPGETKKQFDDTVKLCKKIDFDGAYINQYSPRKGTLAQKKYEDNVPRIEKKRRWEQLNTLINN